MPQPPGPPRLSSGLGPAVGAAGPTATPRFPLPVNLRADPIAAAVCLVAGLFGGGQLLLSWTSVVFSVNLPADGGLTGWQVFRTARAGASLSITSAIGAYSVLGVGLVGGGLILLGLAMLTRVDHRPLGSAGLVLSLLAAAAAIWWLVQARNLTNRGLGEVFGDAAPGWYLFLLAGPVGIVGSMKALITR